MTPEIIVIVLTPAQLSINGNRLARWAIETTDGRTLAAGKRAIDLSAGRPYFDQQDAAVVLCRAKLPTWRHVRAATMRRCTNRAGWIAGADDYPHNTAWGQTVADAKHALIQRYGYRVAFGFTPAQGYRLDSVALQRGPGGEALAYRLTCVMDTDRCDWDSRYHITPTGQADGRVVWMTYFCGDACSPEPVATMGAALALRDAFERERHTKLAGGAV